MSYTVTTTKYIEAFIENKCRPYGIMKIDHIGIRKKNINLGNT
jgi:hypothetical protein